MFHCYSFPSFQQQKGLKIFSVPLVIFVGQNLVVLIFNRMIYKDIKQYLLKIVIVAIFKINKLKDY